MTKRKTTKEFKQQVRQILGKYYKVLGEYKNERTKIRMKHLKCNTSYKALPTNILRGTKCPHCGRGGKTTEDFKKDVYNLVGDKYKVLGQYTGTHNKIKILCPRDHSFYVTPDDFLYSNIRCGYCSKHHKLTPLEFKRLLNKKTNGAYKVLNLHDYKNTSTKIYVEHLACGYKWHVMPTLILNKTRCPYCYRPSEMGKLNRIPLIKFKRQVFKLVGDKFTVLGHYMYKHHSMFRMRCNKCGYRFHTPVSNFLNGNRCARCSGIAKKNTKLFKAEVYDRVGNEYSVVSEYKGNHKYIYIKHNTCGNVYPVRPHRFLSGDRCPKCHMSKGEKKISNYLDNRQLHFQHGYISNCKYNKYLHFDFWNLNHLIAIEYDGIQHFKPIDFSGKKTRKQTIGDFHELQKRDAYKDAYCALHGIKLIRIKYTDYDNIGKILDQNFGDWLLVKN